MSAKNRVSAQAGSETARHPAVWHVPAAHGNSSLDRTSTVKAAVYYETGGPDVFRYEDVPDPTVGTGLLVRVEAISIEGGDTLHRLQGELGLLPHIVGYQSAGTVVATGTRPWPALSKPGVSPNADAPARAPFRRYSQE